MASTPVTRSPFVQALVSPINLLMLAAAAVAFLLSAWWLFPIGLLLWLVMIVITATDPRTQLRSKVYDANALAQRFRRPFERVERVQVRVFNTIDGSPGAIKRTLKPVQDQIDDLTDQAYQLANRMSVMENHRIVSASNADLRDQIMAMEMKIESTEDPGLKAEFQNTLKSLQERLSSLRDMDMKIERTEAELVTLEHKMNQAVTEIIRFQGMRPAQVKPEVDKLVAELARESTEMDNIR